MGIPKQICILGYAGSTENYQKAFEDTPYKTLLPLKDSSPFDLLNDPFSVQKYVSESDLLILPGGGDIDPFFFHQKNTASRNVDFVLDRIQFEFLDAFVTHKKPVVGICKGMQVINVYFGGDLMQNMSASSLKIHAYNQKDSYHNIYLTSDNRLSNHSVFRCPVASLNKDLLVNSAHHQSLLHLGNSLSPLHVADDNTIETIYHHTLPVIGLQWHPERLYTDGSNCLTPIVKELLKL